MAAERQPFWALVEVKGHTQHAGLAHEDSLCGHLMLRVDVFLPGGDTPFASPLVDPTSFHRVTPITEEQARALAAKHLLKHLDWDDYPVPLALPAAPDNDVKTEHSLTEYHAMLLTLTEVCEDLIHNADPQQSLMSVFPGLTDDVHAARKFLGGDADSGMPLPGIEPDPEPFF